MEHFCGRGAVDLGNLEEGWAMRTAQFGVVRPARTGRILVYRVFGLWSNMGPFTRATTAVHENMHPDE